MDKSIKDLVFELIDQTISSQDFDKLQDLLERDVDARVEYLRVLRVLYALEDVADRDPFTATTDQDRQASKVVDSGDSVPSSGWDLRSPGWLFFAAATLLLVGSISFWYGRQRPEPNVRIAEQVDEATKANEEPLIAGHATLRRSVDLAWGDDRYTFREGDVLPRGELEFEGGIAEIDFFCGASLIIEGPARLDLRSDWEVLVHRGRLRANVPPAARGFVVRTSDAEIIDLGTRFALDVDAGQARVKVIDGEVELRGGKYDGDHLVTGQARMLYGDSEKPVANSTDSFSGLSTDSDVDQRLLAAESERLDSWRQSVNQQKTDHRLIAYYPMGMSDNLRTIPNVSPSGSRRDGTVIGPVDRVQGRFGAQSVGLEFDRPGSRVRTRIDGTFKAYTFVCWVRIDSLKNRYNALFMGDGYENGEPHWQIRDDGKLMFSVMVDDSQVIERFNEIDGRVVRDAGLHRVYYSDPIWDITKSGRWFHLAAVYDPAHRVVMQYVNGKRVSREEIIDTFYIADLAIGPAEIGNWGQPFRETPWFAVRNLHGTIDELAIYNAALNEDELVSLFERGKPLGY